MRSAVFQINTHRWGISLLVDVTGLPELGGRDFLDIRVYFINLREGCFCLDLSEQFYSDGV